jgi:S1-C subfamily serine protease
MRLSFAGLATFLSLSSAVNWALAADPVLLDFSKLMLGPGGSLAASPAQVLASFERPQAVRQKLAVSRVRERGAAAEVYAKVAPATVLIKAETPSGDSWGTGIICDADGWVITNHHVIADTLDDLKGPRPVTIYRGRIADDFMQLIDEGLPAMVYKSDKDRDLALLKLSRLPLDKEKLPVVELAKQSPKPGTDCVVVGHPAAGTLWTARSGEIVGLAKFPDELIQAVMARLGSRKKPTEPAAVKQSFAAAPQWKVLVTNCNVNHGDSGGPLLNAAGELIGVTIGMPSSAAAAGSSSVLSYHVHLDEVKSFLAKRPEQPTVEIPDPWPAALFSKLLDEDNDGTPDTLAFSLTDGGPLCGVLLDLNQGTAAKQPSLDVAEIAAKRSWKFQFALTIKPALRAFYDTTGSGQIDLILTGRESDMMAAGGWRRESERWVSFQPQREKLLDAARFKDAAERQRFTKVLNRLTGNSSSGK